MEPIPCLGVSACLLGHPVRYNGAHKRNDWLVEKLGRHVTWVALCPEMEMGLGSPRETMRLVAIDSEMRLLSNKNQTDLTSNALETSGRILGRGFCFDGYIFKKDSPSCGLNRVKLYSTESGIPTKNGVGIFAAQVAKRYPLLPMTEEGRLSDCAQREHFLARVFARARFRSLTCSVGALQKFHQDYKLLLMAHAPTHYARLGKLAANHQKLEPRALFEAYETLFFEALALTSSLKNRINALHHAQGHLKNFIDSREKKHLLECIEEYRRREISFAVPSRLVLHLALKFSLRYLADQYFFRPYPPGI